MPVLSIAILAEYALLGEAWSCLLQGQPGLSVAGMVEQPSQLADLALNQQFNAVLMDWSTPDRQIVQAANQATPQAGLLALVDPLEHQRQEAYLARQEVYLAQVMPLLLAGATGVLSRRASAAELTRSLLATSRGELVLPPEIAVQALLALVQAEAPKTLSIAEREAGMADALSEREGEVLNLLSLGLTNKDIAQRLFLSLRTVEAHLRNIYAKLGVHNRTEAVLWAVRRG